MIQFRPMRWVGALVIVLLIPACSTVAPIDCAQFPRFGPDADITVEQLLTARRGLLAEARSYPSPDRITLSAAYAALGDYDSAFEAALLADGSGSREDAHLEIVVAAADNGDLDTALRAAEPISYNRNVARANLAIAVARGKAGQDQAARSSVEAARDANRNMIRQYAFHSLLSWQFAQAGDFSRAIEQAEKISDDYWNFRAFALIRVAWSFHQSGDEEAAIRVSGSARAEIDRALASASRRWGAPSLEFLLAELYFQLGDYRASEDLLEIATNFYRTELYNAGDFDRVSAVLLWNDLAEVTGSSLASGYANEMTEQAIQNLIIDNRTIGVPSLFHDFSKAELVRLLMERGRSDWVYSTYDRLGGDAHSSLGVAIAHAEASRGNLERALSAASQIDELRDQCIALVRVFVEPAAQDRGDDALRIVETMDGMNCFRLAPELPDDLYADLATSAAALGDGAATCQALQAVERGDPWRAAVADIADARASKGDFSGTRSIVRWANSTGNLDGTQSSEILAGIAAVDPDSRDQTDIYPPVLGSTKMFAELQRWTRRDSIWFEDGIWDQ